MFIRILGGGLVLVLIAVLGTLSFVGLRKASDLDGRLVKTSRQVKENEAAIKQLKAELEGLQKASHGQQHAGPAHWDYAGEMGPDNWGKAFPVCGTGKAQSPVDITAPFEKSSVAIKPDYKPGALKMVNNGHTVQVNVPPGSTLKVGAETYELVQFHFHRPSEEKIDGKPMAMVAHLVHKSAEGKLAVVAVLLRESAAQNRALWSIFKNMPAKEGPEVTVAGVSLNPASLLPETLGHYYYEGSLTTPPCTEGVKFFVLKTPVGIQKELIDSFPFKMNARPVQPLNGRKIAAS